ncbi:hypothetical protein MUG84_16160 [Paenibacillus sp. KQZ6P-2]|uniref:Uncharacterized protein n=1 Tax=Paenibacillus mangrovi TaxID=2931978 RepID=A0A9X1WRD7_9BACL|nr:hypothetical protein [Paenibacillus mangrovi]MCJ8013266.1 hypothetical protein [Paenibacillus mangrovi]
MKKISILFFVFFMLVHAEVMASWAYPFVVYNKGIYEATLEQVSPDLIGDSIGKVTLSSDREGTYRGNFSNYHPKGTVYYAIIGTSPAQEIAVQAEDGLYIKAVFKGPYTVAESANSSYIWICMVIAAVLVLVVFVIYHRLHRRTS